MKRYFILLFLCLPLLTAAAPVLPTTGLYINDYGVAVTQNHREFILETSALAYEQTGYQVVVLTTKSLAGMEPAAYGETVRQDWTLSGQLDGNNAVLILLSTGEKEFGLFPGSGLEETFPTEELERIRDLMTPSVEAGNFSKAIFEGYKAVVLNIYSYAGIQPGEELLAQLQPGVEEKTENWFSMAAFVILGLLVALRGVMISRKYHNRYGKGRAYKPRRRTRKVEDFDEPDDKGIIGFDD